MHLLSFLHQLLSPARKNIWGQAGESQKGRAYCPPGLLSKQNKGQRRMDPSDNGGKKLEG